MKTIKGFQHCLIVFALLVSSSALGRPLPLIAAPQSSTSSSTTQPGATGTPAPSNLVCCAIRKEKDVAFCEERTKVSCESQHGSLDGVGFSVVEPALCDSVCCKEFVGALYSGKAGCLYSKKARCQCSEVVDDAICREAEKKGCCKQNNGDYRFTFKQYCLIHDGNEVDESNCLAPKPPPPPADGGSCCLCLYGNSPAWQVPIFQLGCNTWLGEQKNCRTKISKQMDPKRYVPEFHDDPWNRICHTTELPSECKGSDVNLGYVGHWTGYLTNFFVRDMVTQVCFDQSCSLQIHNTACHFLENGKSLQDFLNTLSLPKDVQVSLKGSQCMSSGLWPKFGLCSTSSNHECTVVLGCNSPIYPKCQDVIASSCEAFQVNTQGAKCEDTSGALRSYSCCSKKVVTRVGAKEIVGTVFTWQEGATCPSAPVTPFPTPSPKPTPKPSPQ